MKNVSSRILGNDELTIVTTLKALSLALISYGSTGSYQDNDKEMVRQEFDITVWYLTLVDMC